MVREIRVVRDSSSHRSLGDRGAHERENVAVNVRIVRSQVIDHLQPMPVFDPVDSRYINHPSLQESRERLTKFLRRVRARVQQHFNHAVARLGVLEFDGEVERRRAVESVLKVDVGPVVLEQVLETVWRRRRRAAKPRWRESRNDSRLSKNQLVILVDIVCQKQGNSRVVES